MHKVEELEIRLHNDPSNEELGIELSEAKDRLEARHRSIAEGAAVRSRAKYYVDGEKPTRLFCSLEQKNGAQKFIPFLKVEVREGNQTRIKEVKEQKEIEEEVKNFYSDLYSNKDGNIRIENIEDFLDNDTNSLPKLSEEVKNSMEGELTIEEAANYLKKCKNNASPGATGFTAEFYKFFWSDIRLWFVTAANKSLQEEKLPISQSLGIVTLLPKGEKEKCFLKNWRPITLLNCFYKIISGCIAARIRPNLESIIHSDQKGFVPKRCMGPWGK